MITGRISRILVSPSDARDRKYQYRRTALDSSVDLRDWASLVEDQGDLGSCTSLAVTAAYEIQSRTQYPEQFAKLSDLYIYYNARIFYSEVSADDGAYLRDSLKAIKRFGACRDELWPYDITRYDQQPTADCYTDAQYRTITNYQILLNKQEMLEVVNLGRPVVIGIKVYPGFDYLTQEDSVVAMPDSDEQVELHAMCVLGYDLDRELWLAQNSYGVGWGDMGYCWIPFEYMESQVIERWCFDISDPRTVLLA